MLQVRGGYWHKQPSASTKVVIAFCGVLSTYIGIVEYRHMMHPHAHEDIAYSHMKIRAKPYPWDCPDCNLFEAQCFRDCKAAAKE